MNKTQSLMMLLVFAQTNLVWGAADGLKSEPVGQVGMIEGEVYVDQARVKKSAQVREGSIVEVKKGKATLIVGKGNVFHLSNDSKMVVAQFDAKPATDGKTKEEVGQLDLKFGRTRALIMNSGNEKKDLKIKSRAATMGVRGTEIYIDSPRDTAKPINFFTLEGRADVKANDVAPPVPVNQNQGVSTTGAAAPAGSGGQGGSGGNTNGAGAGGNGSGTATTGTATGTAGVAGGDGPKPGSGISAATVTMAEVKNDIKGQGMSFQPINTPQDMRRQVTQQYMSDQFGMGALPPLVLDPLQDRFTPVQVKPVFCNATTGVCP